MYDMKLPHIGVVVEHYGDVDARRNGNEGYYWTETFMRIEDIRLRSYASRIQNTLRAKQAVFVVIPKVHSCFQTEA